MAKLFIITGPSGIGKSTVSNALASKLARCAIVEGDDIYNQVVSGAVKPWLKGNHLDVMWKNCIAIIKNYLDAGIDVIFNYIIHKETLKMLREAFSGYEMHFILMMANKETIIARDESRDEDVQVHRTEEHIKNYKKDGYDKTFVLDTDTLSIDDEVEEILRGKFLLNNPVSKVTVSGLQKHFFDMVCAGRKIYEGRVNDEKRRQINVGDYYIFALEPQRDLSVKTQVVEKLYFKNFEELCNKLQPRDVGFTNRDEMLAEYNKFYSLEEQKKYGVVAFKIKLVKGKADSSITLNINK